MELAQYQLTTLPNGLRVGTACLPGRQSAAAGIWCGAGSRHETRTQSGVAHLVEHMVFKGTARRSARKISLDIEGVGGELNAFTSEDHTCYHAVVPAHRLPDAADVLVDLYRNARFSARDCRREKQVILEEIQMYRENPSQHVDDMLSAALWPDHPLGKLITGTPESLEALQIEDLSAWTEAHHVGSNTVFAVASPWSHAEVLSCLRPWLESLPTGKPPVMQPYRRLARPARVLSDTRDIEQTHVALGFRTPGRHHSGRFALRLLSVILGETMGSRLFQALREKRGLCYSVNTETDVFAETGLLEIYTAVESSRLEPAMRALGKEVHKVLAQAPTGKELERAKEFTLGQQAIWFESTTNQMHWVAESLLGHGSIHSAEASREKILGVTSADLAAIAARIFQPDRAAAAIIGPEEYPKSAPHPLMEWLGW